MRFSWFQVALLNLLIAALLGVFMRYFFVGEVSAFKFMNIMYGHSHVVLMGWGFLGIYSLIDHSFLSDLVDLKNRKRNFCRILQVLIIGMLVAFPFLGYAPASIAISSLLILTTYGLLWIVFNAIRRSPSIHPVVRMFLLTAIFYYLLSTLALWSMAPIMASGLKGTAIYYMAIQFFLHFQINGWFIFAIIGLVLHLLTNSGYSLRDRVWKNVYTLLFTSTILTYALAVSWSTPSPVIFAINSLGAFIQLIAMVLLFRELIRLRNNAIQIVDSWVFKWIGFALICLALKVVIQTAVIFPPIAVIAYTIRNYVIGFIHLILLGMVSHFLLAEGFRRNWLDPSNSLARAGMIIFSLGFVLTEVLLFLQGTLVWARLGIIPYFYTMLFSVTLLLPLGIFMLLFSSIMSSSLSSEKEIY